MRNTAWSANRMSCVVDKTTNDDASLDANDVKEESSIKYERNLVAFMRCDFM